MWLLACVGTARADMKGLHVPRYFHMSFAFSHAFLQTTHLHGCPSWTGELTQLQIIMASILTTECFYKHALAIYTNRSYPSNLKFLENCFPQPITYFYFSLIVYSTPFYVHNFNMYGGATSSSSDENDILFVAGAALLFGPDAEPFGGPIQKVPCRTSALTGRQWVEEVMSGYHTRIMDATRLTVDSFMRLCNILADCGFVPQHHQKRVTIEEALAMTLVMMSHNMRMRMIADRFNHSLETVHRNIHEVIKGLCTFAQFIITPRRQDEVHPKIMNDPRFYPWFEVCLAKPNPVTDSSCKLLIGWFEVECICVA